MSYCSPVRLLLWIILAFLVLFAFAAPNTEWIAWLLGVILLAIFLMLDAMFSNPADFVFDPSVSGNGMLDCGAVHVSRHVIILVALGTFARQTWALFIRGGGSTSHVLFLLPLLFFLH